MSTGPILPEGTCTVSSDPETKTMSVSLQMSIQGDGNVAVHATRLGS